MPSSRRTTLTTTYSDLFNTAANPSDGAPFHAGSVTVSASAPASARVQVAGIHDFNDANDYYLVAPGATKQFGVRQANGNTGGITRVQARADSSTVDVTFDVDFR